MLNIDRIKGTNSGRWTSSDNNSNLRLTFGDQIQFVLSEVLRCVVVEARKITFGNY